MCRGGRAAKKCLDSQAQPRFFLTFNLPSRVWHPQLRHILSFKACRRAIKFGDPLTQVGWRCMFTWSSHALHACFLCFADVFVFALGVFLHVSICFHIMFMPFAWFFSMRQRR